MSQVSLELGNRVAASCSIKARWPCVVSQQQQRMLCKGRSFNAYTQEYTADISRHQGAAWTCRYSFSSMASSHEIAIVRSHHHRTRLRGFLQFPIHMVAS